MKNLKIGQQLIVTSPVKVYYSNSSCSGYVELIPGTILLVTKKNEKSYTVAYRVDFNIMVSSEETFILPGFNQDRLKLEDLDKVSNLPTKWQDLIKIKELYKKS